jgi:RNA polymerase sigma-70 factor (ECF subfamily)
VQEIKLKTLVDAQAGNEVAFTHLVETFQTPVYNLCYRMLGNAQEAEDAAQESFLRAYKKLGSFDIKRSFATWLLSIAAHYCIDLIRRRRFNLVSIEELSKPHIPDHSLGIETQVQNREREEKVRALLDYLNPIDKAAIVLYYWYDLSYREICDTLSISESALKSRLFRARKTMAEKWGEAISESQTGNILTKDYITA